MSENGIGRRKGPFTPGFGKYPVVFAGRDQELERIDGHLASLRAKVPPDSDVVIVGPRGVGKTVFLEHVERRIDEEPFARVVRVTGGNLANVETFATAFKEAFENRREEIETTERESLEFSGKVLGSGIGVKTSNRPASRELTARNLTGHILKVTTPSSLGQRASRAVASRRATRSNQASQEPVLLMIDEAHKAEAETLGTLFETSQSLKNDFGAPFLIALAGTPGLDHLLTECNSMFGTRCRQVRMGRLGLEASREVLEGTMATLGRMFDEGTLHAAAELTHGHSHFVQTMGQALDEAAERTGSAVIAARELEIASPGFEYEKELEYGSRFNEIAKRQLRRSAVAVALAMKDRDRPFEEWELEKALAAAKVTSARIREDIQALAAIGFVWQENKTQYVKAIPSLMTHVLAHSKDLTDELATVICTGPD